MQTGYGFVLYNQLEPLATKKCENFQQFRAIYPEFKCVFIGDNGQGTLLPRVVPSSTCTCGSFVCTVC
jgi:hypothetical protein